MGASKEKSLAQQAYLPAALAGTSNAIEIVFELTCNIHIIQLTSVCGMQPARQATQGIKELFIPPAVHCMVCSDRFEEEYKHEANVFHGKRYFVHLAFGPMALCISLTVLALQTGQATCSQDRDLPASMHNASLAFNMFTAFPTDNFGQGLFHGHVHLTHDATLA